MVLVSTNWYYSYLVLFYLVVLVVLVVLVIGASFSR